MSLDQLDAFLAQALQDPALGESLAQPLELAAFLALAQGAGYAINEADVLAAQAREEERLSDQDLQARAGEEARRLRSFIYS
jgi:predicted ribosomally synthesized peptide with nif11-like leader